MVGRYFAYSASLNGMTVLSPSLPPVSWTTTRIVSFAPGLPASGAAMAVRLRNRGTVRPQATRPVDFRKSRRVGIMGPSLIQLKFGQCQHQMADGPDTMVSGVGVGPVARRALLPRRLQVVEQARRCLGRGVALQ